MRLVFDGWLLPLAGAYWQTHIDGFFDYRNNLQSFGLIIISLLANQFWKPGLGRGLLGLGVTVGLTYLIVRYGLMELTNFTISRIGYLYEDLAFSVLASPKAYIILLTTAFVADPVEHDTQLQIGRDRFRKLGQTHAIAHPGHRLIGDDQDP